MNIWDIKLGYTGTSFTRISPGVTANQKASTVGPCQGKDAHVNSPSRNVACMLGKGSRPLRLTTFRRWISGCSSYVGHSSGSSSRSVNPLTPDSNYMFHRPSSS